MQNTTHYNLKKPDYTDFADIQDINDNMDTIDEQLAAPTGDARDQVVSFTDADLDTGITSFPNFLTKIVSGMKLAKFLRDFKAGMAYVLHTGSLINNATCTESGKALDARMGKTLQDQITSLNDSFHESVSETLSTNAITVKVRKTGNIYSAYCSIAKTVPSTWTSIGYLTTVIPQGAEHFGQFIANNGNLIKIRTRTDGEVLMYAINPVTSQIYVESATLLAAA